MKIFRVYSSANLVALAMALIFSPIRVKGQNAAQASKPSEASAGNAENGKRIYTKYGCYECHGLEGQGAVTGPRLGPDPIPLKAFTSYVRNPTGNMPPYTAKVVSDQEMADLFAFLAARPHPPALKNIPILK
ncbi:MAG: cytochrome c [Candidatus Acidiferrales bacterium]|jgi:ubiquinol-cytochrome c reductase cytochrome c subunit